MSEGDGMTEVTEADRAKAIDVLASARADEMWRTDNPSDLVTRIAAALAEERAKARAPFLALADEYDLIPLDHAEARRIVRKVADRIRQAAEDAP